MWSFYCQKVRLSQVLLIFYFVKNNLPELLCGIDCKNITCNLSFCFMAMGTCLDCLLLCKISFSRKDKIVKFLCCKIFAIYLLKCTGFSAKFQLKGGILILTLPSSLFLLLLLALSPSFVLLLMSIHVFVCFVVQFYCASLDFHR